MLLQLLQETAAHTVAFLQLRPRGFEPGDRAPAGTAGSTLDGACCRTQFVGRVDQASASRAGRALFGHGLLDVYLRLRNDVRQRHRRRARREPFRQHESTQHGDDTSRKRTLCRAPVSGEDHRGRDPAALGDVHSSAQSAAARPIDVASKACVKGRDATADDASNDDCFGGRSVGRGDHRRPDMHSCLLRDDD